MLDQWCSRRCCLNVFNVLALMAICSVAYFLWVNDKILSQWVGHRISVYATKQDKAQKVYVCNRIPQTCHCGHGGSCMSTHVLLNFIKQD